MNTELQRIYEQMLGKMNDVEQTLIEQLPKMATMATREDLKEALTSHLEETRQQKARLDAIQSDLGGGGTVPDPAFRHILEESERILSEVTDTEARDMLIIASAQVVEHYEIAHYEALSVWSEKLGADDAYNSINISLAEEETTLANLTALATGSEIDEIIDDLTR